MAPLARRLGGVDGHEAIWLASGAGDGFVHEIHHENLSVLHVPPFKVTRQSPPLDADTLLVLISETCGRAIGAPRCMEGTKRHKPSKSAGGSPRQSGTIL